MVVLTKMNVMTVGMERLEELERMPIRLLRRDTGKEAVRSFKHEDIDTVICRWDLADMPDGLFVRKLRMVRQDISVIAIVSANDRDQEVQARMLGSTVIADDCSEGYFQRVIFSALGLPQPQPDYHAVHA